MIVQEQKRKQKQIRNRENAKQSNNRAEKLNRQVRKKGYNIIQEEKREARRNKIKAEAKRRRKIKEKEKRRAQKRRKAKKTS